MLSTALSSYIHHLSKSILRPFWIAVLRTPKEPPAVICREANPIQTGQQFTSLLGGNLNGHPSSSTSTTQETPQTDLQRKIYTPEPEVQERLKKVNEKLSKQGKPPIDFQAVTREIESVMDDPKLSDKDKKNKIGEIRKRLGIGKGDMKALFTKRLSKIYNQEAQQTQSNLGPTPENLEHKSKLYGSMFRSFWSKLGGVFKKIGKVFSKIMDAITPILRMIPGIGQIVAYAWTAVKGIYQLVKGNLKGFLNTIMNALPGIPGVGSLLSKASGFATKAISRVGGVLSKASSFVTKA